MAEDKKEFGVLSDLAEIADRVSEIYRGKATIEDGSAKVNLPEYTIEWVDFTISVTPIGKPIAVPIPVALVVAKVISESAVFIHKVGVEEAFPTVIFAFTVINVSVLKVKLALSTIEPLVDTSGILPELR
jgi:hypothetical protein